MNRKKLFGLVMCGAMLLASTSVFTSCKDYNDDINDLQSQIDATNKDLKDLQTALAAANAAIAQAQKDIDAAQGDATQALLDASAAMSVAKANKLLIETAIQDIENNKTAISVINGKLDTVDEAIATINNQINALNNFKDLIAPLKLETAFPALQAQVADLTSKLEALAASHTEDIDALKAEMKTLSDEINKVSSSLNILIQQRLTSMIFDDTQSVNGIPAVTFITLNYTPWTLNEAGIAVAPAADAESTVANGEVVANYYLNPSSVDQASITALETLLKDGTNIITRAGDAEKATLSVKDYTIANGVMAVTLTKTGTFTDTETTSTSGDLTVESFQRFAVQATILPTSADEEAPIVTSGFARIFDYEASPLIHNATDPMKPADAEYFFTYEEITAGTEDADFVAADLPYNETLDLNTLADVIANGLPITMSQYNLTFKFSLIAKSDVVSISDAGVISATDQSVVGSTSTIQVLLMDGENIVDAKYFDVLWTAAGKVDLGIIDTFDVEFDSESCEISYSDTVFSNVLKEKVYDVLGIDEAAFVNLYALNADAFASSEIAIAGTPAATDLGSLSYVENTKVTGNPYVLVWDLDIVDNPITQDEFDAGVAVRTVYGRFEGKAASNSSVYVFGLTMNINVAKVKFAGAYLSTYWENGPIASTNDSKVRVVNPTMMSDAVYGTSKFYSTQIIASLMTGYTEKFTTPLDLVEGATEAKFIFDAERVASMTTLGANWVVSTEGDSLYYKYESGLVAAAAISAEGVINLVEDPEATLTVPGTPTDAAIKLLALADNKVPVKLVGSYCSGGDTDFAGTVDAFLVRFIKPLTMTVTAPTPNVFIDLEQKGYTIDVSTLVTITGFGSTGVVLSNGNTTGDTEALQKWFNVTAVTWDLDNAITNLVEDAAGNISVSSSTNYADWSEWNAVKGKYDFTSTDATVGGIELTQTLTFINFSGSALTESFKVAIPVVAKTKWNTALYDVNQQYVEFVIQPGNIN